MSDILERDFERQVLDLAAIFGFESAHFRPAQTAKGWRTPVAGSLGKGWPDWFFARPRDGRVMWRELKSRTGKVSPDQERVIGILRACRLDAGVWRPADLDSGLIATELR